jgi:hypothetical protein
MEEQEKQAYLVYRAVDLGSRTNRAIRTSLGYSPKRHEPNVDRALQRLRKRGLIVVRDGQWYVASKRTTCSHCGGSGQEPTPSPRP